jgi:hypothetical protein
VSSHGPDPERTGDSNPTEITDTTAVEPTTDASTSALERNDMSDNEIRRSDESQEFRDPTADPTPDPADPTSPAAPAGATSLSSQLGWPELPPSTTASSTASSSVPTTAAAESTSPIPTISTREVPVARPFRVEPATPVPDDVVTEPDQVPGTGLPHLPPPAAPAPVAPRPREAARPALVVVRRGPRPGAIMLGLLSMIVAAYVLVANLTGTDVNLRLVGPPMIGAFGGLLLIVGLVGVVSGRMRR